jgi:HEAT repeat protein
MVAAMGGDPNWQIETVREARERGDVKTVVAALTSTDQEVRWVAANSLRKLGSPEAAGALLRVARDSKDDRLRTLSLKALAAIGDSSMSETLVDIATDENQFEVRLTAISALADLGDRRATGLLAAVVGDVDLPAKAGRLRARSATRWAIQRLVDLDAVDAVPALDASLQHLAFRERRHAQRALRELRALEPPVRRNLS